MEIEYFRNPYNLGADWNIFSCMLNCNTEYLWILSTNDLIKSDSVIGILNEINVAKKNECCFVHMGQSEQFYTIGINEFVDKIVYDKKQSYGKKINRLIQMCKELENIPLKQVFLD